MVESLCRRAPAVLVGALLSTFTSAQLRIVELDDVRALTWDFADDALLDHERSSGSWGIGFAFPGFLGGDGLHGDFDVTLGRALGNGVYEWNVDNMLIPADRTLSGQVERVTDGVFRFATFHLPAGTTLRFVGFEVPRIHVRGNVRIDGTIDVSGVDQPQHEGSDTFGQRGGLGGPFAGRGGAGGDKNVSGTGPSPQHDGKDGERLVVPGGHAYAGRALGTEGKGSVEWPASGLVGDVRNSILPFIGLSLLTSAGGGGAGYLQAGAAGRVVSTLGDFRDDQGPPAAGGSAYHPFPKVGGSTTFDHFLVGGGGGGGGGSHAFGSLNASVAWKSGAAGGGGGGPLGLRLGGNLTMAATARILARGGEGGSSAPSAAVSRACAPGGGGSGGSVVLQVEGDTSLDGTIDARGGAGGVGFDPQVVMRTEGGAGSDGYLRLERTVPPTPADLGATFPPAGSSNVRALTEVDAIVGSASLWRRAAANPPGRWVRYAIRAIVDGRPVVFSDDPTYRDPQLPSLPNVGLATDGRALRLLVQAAEVRADGSVVNGSERPWRRLVGASPSEPSLNDDHRNGLRFALLFDRRIGIAIVDDVKVFFAR